MAGACAEPGPTRIGQGVGEWQGHSCKKVLTPISYGPAVKVELEPGLAAPDRIGVEEAIQYGRYGAKVEPHDARRRDSRSRH